MNKIVLIIFIFFFSFISTFAIEYPIYSWNNRYLYCDENNHQIILDTWLEYCTLLWEDFTSYHCFESWLSSNVTYYDWSSWIEYAWNINYMDEIICNPEWEDPVLTWSYIINSYNYWWWIWDETFTEEEISYIYEFEIAVMIIILFALFIYKINSYYFKNSLWKS